MVGFIVFGDVPGLKVIGGSDATALGSGSRLELTWGAGVIDPAWEDDDIESAFSEGRLLIEALDGIDFAARELLELFIARGEGFGDLLKKSVIRNDVVSRVALILLETERIDEKLLFLAVFRLRIDVRIARGFEDLCAVEVMGRSILSGVGGHA